MSQADRDRWNARYKVVEVSTVPASAALDWLPSPRDPTAVALDIACGTGRNTRALLDAGFRVVAADISRIALAKLRASLSPENSLSLVEFDIGSWPFAEASFDVVIQVDFLERAALTDVRRTVKPGGLLLIDTFAGEAVSGAPGPRRAEWRLARGELVAQFADWEVLRIDEPPGLTRASILARRPTRSGTPLR